MDPALLSNIKDIGIASLSVVIIGGILYLFMKGALGLLYKMQDEHKEDQLWFREFVNTNNHQKTDLITKVAENIAQSTAVMEAHTKAIDRLIDRLQK